MTAKSCEAQLDPRRVTPGVYSRRFVIAFLATAAVSTAACDAEPPPPLTVPVVPDQPWVFPDRPTCHLEYPGIPSNEGAVEDPFLVEASGLVASPTQPGVLWTHNDSGDLPRIYALGTDGSAIARVEIDDAPIEDLEDIAVASCPDASGPCLWLADTGNNARNRGDLAVYVVPEPDLTTPNVRGRPMLRLPIEYPDEPIDSEALLVAADGSALWLIEKTDDETARVFELKAPFEDATLVEVAQVTSPGIGALAGGRMITAADLHPSGTRIALRTYTGVFEFRLADGGTPRDLGDTLATVITFGPADEPQGEAIAYDEEGYGIWTLSEVPDGRPGPPLHHFACGE